MVLDISYYSILQYHLYQKAINNPINPKIRKGMSNCLIKNLLLDEERRHIYLK